MEFRTKAPGKESGGSKSDFERIVEQIWGNIQKDPEAQYALAQSLHQEYGVDPIALQSIFPKMTQAEAARAASQPSEAPQEAQTEPQHQNEDTEEIVTVKKPSPEELLAFVDELIELHPEGEDCTLGDLKKIGENRPEILETAIEMKL